MYLSPLAHYGCVTWPEAMCRGALLNVPDIVRHSLPLVQVKILHEQQKKFFISAVKPVNLLSWVIKPLLYSCTVLYCSLSKASSGKPFGLAAEIRLIRALINILQPGLHGQKLDPGTKDMSFNPRFFVLQEQADLPLRSRLILLQILLGIRSC